MNSELMNEKNGVFLTETLSSKRENKNPKSNQFTSAGIPTWAS